MDTQSFFSIERFRRMFLLVGCAAMFVACAKGSNTSSPVTIDSGSSQATTPDYVPLAWESGHPERVAWSSYLYSQIANEYSTLNAATDIANFCPNYEKLSQTQRIEVWAELIVEVSYYESSWDPTNRYEETTLGIDPVTGQPVWSEGLMQMSYQDTLWMPSCRFDWSVDKNLSPTDPNKTILQPDINLQCGVFVLANQIKLHGAVALSTNVYWSTLRAGSAILGDIQRNVNADLSFCH